MDELERARIRVYRNDPAGRGERLVSAEAPVFVDEGTWAFRIDGRAPAPGTFKPDTPEFLYWQLASALDRGKRLWSRRFPSGQWVPGKVLPAVPVAGEDLNAYYDRRALRFFRFVDPKTGQIVQSGESVDVSTHEQGHAVLDGVRPDLWDAPHFEVASFHEGFGDLAAIFVALAEPPLSAAVIGETSGEIAHSNLVSRLAEELGSEVRRSYGDDAALPQSLRDAVNDFHYVDPKTLPDAAPASELSAEPHSFCNVLTGACWDLLVVLFRHTSRKSEPEDRGAALTAAAETLSIYAASAAETAPTGADFFGRFARRIVREADAASDPAAPELARSLFHRGLLASPEVPPELEPDEDRRILAPPEEDPIPPAILAAIDARLPAASRGEGEIVKLSMRRSARAAGARVLRGRRRRDLFLHGTEYGPADGAAVEISDAFALAFSEAGFLRASRTQAATSRDAEDARAFVRFLARRRAIADEVEARSSTSRLVRERKSHAVVREPDGVRRVRRMWVQGNPVEEDR
jgi:hypothetical protein